MPFDISKAFDKVNHQILLSKFNSFMPKPFIKWLENFLTDRKQTVMYENCKSKLIPVTSLVPQGSILSPILFNIYINDLKISKPNGVIKYADDTTFLAPNFSKYPSNINKVCETFKTWCANNKLIVNENNTIDNHQ